MYTCMYMCPGPATLSPADGPGIRRAARLITTMITTTLITVILIITIIITTILTITIVTTISIIIRSRAASQSRRVPA